MTDKDNTRKEVVSGLFWKFAESVCADLVSFVVSVILARILLPEDYGEISLVNVFIVIANVFVVNGLGTALVQKKDADDLDFSSVFYTNILLSVLLYGLIFFSAPFIAQFYRMPHLASVLRVLAVRIPLAAINSVQNAFVSRKMIFRKFFFATIIGTIISAVVGIWMAYTGYGVWALVAQILTNALIDTIVLFLTVRWYPKWMFSFQRLKGLFNYGWKILGSSLIKTGYTQLSNLIIGKLYTSEDLAFYSRGKKYPELVTSGIDSAICSVLFPAISKKQDDLNKVKAMTRRAMKTSTFILAPVMAELAALASPLVSWMLTDKWLSCVPFLQIYCFYYLVNPIQSANLQAIRAIGRSDVILKLDIIKRGSGIIFLLLFMKRGPIGVALAPIAMILVCTIVNIAANRRLIQYSYKEQFIDLFPTFLTTAVMGGLVFLISQIMHSAGATSFVVLFTGFLLGVAIFIGLSVLLKNETFFYILNIIKGFLARRKCKEKT